MRFTKMHGIGNDYIYFDGAKEQISDPGALAIRLSDRHFSVGGDGIVLILPSDVADVRMRMWNADGSEGKMCGNAIRCVGKYAYERGLCVKDVIRVETASGIKTLYLNIKNGVVESVRVDMGAPILENAKIPVAYEGSNLAVPVTTKFSNKPLTCVSMGNPHAVLYIDGIAALDLPKIGPMYERHPMFPEGVNTEFVEVIDRNTLNMRVWERGSGETLACGTGACAVAVASVLNGFCPRGEEITVRLIGGELSIRWDEETVWMTGPASFAFEGEVE